MSSDFYLGVIAGLILFPLAILMYVVALDAWDEWREARQGGETRP